MPDPKPPLGDVAWWELFPWLRLLRALRVALQARLIVLGAIGLLGTIFGWWLIGSMFTTAGGTNETRLATWIAAYGSCPWTDHSASPGNEAPFASGRLARGPNFTDLGAANSELGSEMGVAETRSSSIGQPPRLGRAPSDPVFSIWWQLSAPFRQAFDADLRFTELAFLLMCALWALAVWGLMGGMITRMAAMRLGRDEGVGLAEAFSHARRRWTSYFAAPLFPLLGVMLIVIPLAIGGALMRFDVGVYLGAVLWPLALIAGLVIALLLAGAGLGWPLMWATISTEGTDCFDALSRSYSYVYAHPLRYLLYMSFVAFWGLLGWYLVSMFGGGVIHVTAWAASWGTGNERMWGEILDGHGTAGFMGAIGFWNGCVRVLISGFAYAYFWTASTAVYLVLRHEVDGAEMDEVYVDEKQATYGAPPLETDAAGVARVAEETPEEGSQESATTDSPAVTGSDVGSESTSSSETTAPPQTSDEVNPSRDEPRAE